MPSAAGMRGFAPSFAAPGARAAEKKHHGSSGVVECGHGNLGANGAAMPTDEGDQDGHFFYNHPREKATSPPRRAQPLLLLFRSNTPE